MKKEIEILEEEKRVVRPGNGWSLHVQSFLAFLHENGFHNIPKPYGISESGEEMVSFVEGTVYNDCLPEEILSDEILIDVAKMLRMFHDIGEKYVRQLTGEEVWMFPKRLPAEVMCHGDFAPYNVTFVHGHVHGVIDFDTLHPGPRIWDVAYAVYRWIPFVSPSNPDYCYDLKEQIRRLKLFADTYDLKMKERQQLPQIVTERLAALVAYMRKEADSGNKDVRKNIEDGHLDLYLDDIQYIKLSQNKILQGIL